MNDPNYLGGGVSFYWGGLLILIIRGGLLIIRGSARRVRIIIRRRVRGRGKRHKIQVRGTGKSSRSKVKLKGKNLKSKGVKRDKVDIPLDDRFLLPFPLTWLLPFTFAFYPLSSELLTSASPKSLVPHPDIILRIISPPLILPGRGGGQAPRQKSKSKGLKLWGGGSEL